MADSGAPGRGQKRQNEGGGGGRGKKDGKKTKYYSQKAGGAGQAMPLGSRGILVTCDATFEDKASTEAVALIDEHYEKLAKEHGGQQASAAASDGTGNATGKDIASLLAAEVADLKRKPAKRFRVHHTGVKGTFYVLFPGRARRQPAQQEDADAAAGPGGGDEAAAAAAAAGPEAEAAGGEEAGEDEDVAGPGPVEVVLSIVKEVASSKQCRGRHCSRFLPVEATCFAGLDEIKAAAPKLLDRHFPADEGANPIEFAVDYEHRSIDGFDRLSVINCFTSQIKIPPHKVNLSNPSKTVLVQLTRNGCGMAVVEGYKQYAKFNIKKLAEVGEEEAAAAGK